MKTQAIIMAAGLGTRLLPLTKETAKPLLPLCGTTMIETVIRALQQHGITKIYTVVGYKKEQFEFLEQKYNIILIENKEYSYKNNISSIKAASEIVDIEDCYICEADLFISDSSFLSTRLKKSCYFGKFVKGQSDDWVFETQNNRIVHIKKNGFDLYNMAGISFWLKEDLKIIFESVAQAYKEPEHINYYWDEIVDRQLKTLDVSVQPVAQNMIVEIDTLQEFEIFKSLKATI